MKFIHKNIMNKLSLMIQHFIIKLYQHINNFKKQSILMIKNKCYLFNKKEYHLIKFKKVTVIVRHKTQ